MTPSPLDIEATPLRVRELVRRGAIPPLRFDDAIVAISGPHEPRRALQAVLLALATALLVAGIAFFVAANWQALGRFLRLGLVCAGVVAAVVVATVVGPRTTGGRAALTVAGLTIGPALFLYGQTYQTGADAWNLFAGWLLLMLPFALAARFAGLWWLVLLLLHTTLALCLDQRDVKGFDDLEDFLWLFLLIDMAALAVADVVARKTHRRALPRGVAAILGITACGAVAFGIGSRHTTPWHTVDVVVALAAAGWLITMRARDLLRPAVGLFVVGTALAMAVGRGVFDLWHLDLLGVFLVGCVVLGWVAAGTALLRHWHRTSGAAAEDEP